MMIPIIVTFSFFLIKNISYFPSNIIMYKIMIPYIYLTIIDPVRPVRDKLTDSEFTQCLYYTPINVGYTIINTVMWAVLSFDQI